MDQRRQLEEAEGLTCKCGHPRLRHVMLRARCAIDGCDCVQFEVAEKFSLLGTALSLDERLEIALRENERLRKLNRILLDEHPPDEVAATQELERMRGLLHKVASDPTSTRAEVQGLVLRALGL